MIVTKGMTGILQAAFSSAFSKGGVESLKKWWTIIMKFQILIVSPGVLFLVLFAGPIFKSILPKYYDATFLLQTYGLLAFVITVLGGGTHITAFYAINRERIVLYTRILAGFLNLVLDLILIYFFGVLGAIIATGISGIVVGCLELYLAIFNLNTKYPAKFMIKCFACLFIAGFVALRFSGPGILMLLFSGFLYFFVYALSAWVFKPFDKKDIMRINSINSRLSCILACFSTKSEMISLENL